MLRSKAAVALIGVICLAFCAGAVVVLPLALPMASQWGVPDRINHQGVVAVNGVRFTGTGLFKFAIIDNSNVNQWTNDNTQVGQTNTAPDNAVSLPVTDGIYAVGLGDTTLTHMTAVPSSIFSDDSLKLRVWFSDGVNGTQQLSPDHPLATVPYAFMAAGVSGGTTPSGAVMFFNLASCPSGWSELTAAQGRFILSRPAGGTLGATVGSALANQEARKAGAHWHGVANAIQGYTHIDSVYGAPFRTDGGRSDNTWTTVSGYRQVVTATGYGSLTNFTAMTGPSLPDTLPAPYIQLLACQKD